MFPIRDDNPTFLKPVVTLGLIAANVLVWVFVQGMGSEPLLSNSVCSLGLIPAELLHRVTPGMEIPLGRGLACVITDQASWYTVVTSMFLHGGWLHLIGNMWFLWVFGNNIEDSMGHSRFLFFYILTGLAAASAQMAVNPASPIPMVGASGAVSGVMGAYVVLYPRVRVHMLIFLGFFITTIGVRAWLMLGYWFLLQIVGGIPAVASEGGGVAFWAHAGGFVAGATLIFLFRDRELMDRRNQALAWSGWRIR